MKYLLENDLSNKQYGFIKVRSTMLQLPQMTDRWTECLEYDGQIDTIYMYSDFEKAFDKVLHKRLISKLQMYRLNDSLINGICDFLTAEDRGLK